jgi:hypothetical protein
VAEHRSSAQLHPNGGSMKEMISSVLVSTGLLVLVFALSAGHTSQAFAAPAQPGDAVAVDDVVTLVRSFASGRGPCTADLGVPTNRVFPDGRVSHREAYERGRTSDGARTDSDRCRCGERRYRDHGTPLTIGCCRRFWRLGMPQRCGGLLKRRLKCQRRRRHSTAWILDRAVMTCLSVTMRSGRKSTTS